jgi:phosphatidylglycerophosphate synthase
MPALSVHVPGAHVRENRSLLAAVEKRTLVWIARRLPGSITPDHLSTLALAAMVAAGLGFAVLRLTPWASFAVVAALAANWFGDSLDGTVARVRARERPRYGFYADHVLDLAGTTCLFAGLASSGLMHPLTAAIVLIAYLLVSAETYLATHVSGTFRMSFMALGPTELRLLLALGVVKAAQTPWVAVTDSLSLKLFDLGGAIASIGLFAAFVASAVRNIRALHMAESLPSPKDRGVAA